MTPREAATAIWQAALGAGAVEPLVRRALRREGARLVVGART
jgi:hypothetical protein